LMEEHFCHIERDDYIYRAIRESETKQASK
jgi:hypothetical protein